MAGSKYAYVKNFELADKLLPNTFLVVRIDGHGFHRFSEAHGFEKPNDERALKLMDCAACEVMSEYPDIILAYGESDEYSFLLRKSTTLYNRRSSKISSTIVSLFTSNYVLHWFKFFPDAPLTYAPSFDGRVVAYPSSQEVRDYFSWRQVDTHINNLYNTTFWALVLKGGNPAKDAHAALKGTTSSQKNELLFRDYGINYAHQPERYRKGSTIIKLELSGSGDARTPAASRADDRTDKARRIAEPTVLHCDIIGDVFWLENPSILG